MKLNTDPDILMPATKGCEYAPYANPNEHNTEGLLCFRFTRQEVTTADTDRFLMLFAHVELDASALRATRGSLVIQLPATAALHEEPFLCETTRRFCRTLYAKFPGWAFFFSLQSLVYWKMSLALIDDAQIIQSERAWQTRVMLSATSLETLIADQVEQARVFAHRAEMADGEIDRMVSAVRDYFAKVTNAYCRA